MGVSDIFDRSRADLNGLLEWRREPAWVSDAVHKALIEVDEEGTVAAAGTGKYHIRFVFSQYIRKYKTIFSFLRTLSGEFTNAECTTKCQNFQREPSVCLSYLG